MKFDCSKNCKMTAEMRGSKHCQSFAEIIDGRPIFSCEKSLELATEPEKNLLRCQLWDNQIFDACKGCELSCKNNSNPNLQASIDQTRELRSLIESLKPSMVLYGVNDKTIENISKEYKNNKDERVKHALEAAKLSNESMKLLQKGKAIDVAFLSILSSRLIKKIKK